MWFHIMEDWAETCNEITEQEKNIRWRTIEWKKKIYFHFVREFELAICVWLCVRVCVGILLFFSGVETRKK